MDHLLSKELISSKNDFFKESCLTLFGFQGTLGKAPQTVVCGAFCLRRVAF
jgi:hypothetical protein